MRLRRSLVVVGGGSLCDRMQVVNEKLDAGMSLDR